MSGLIHQDYVLKRVLILTTQNKNGSENIRPVLNGGGGGIRTHGTRERTTVFKTAPINRSGTPPVSYLNVFQLYLVNLYCQVHSYTTQLNVLKSSFHFYTIYSLIFVNVRYFTYNISNITIIDYKTIKI